METLLILYPEYLKQEFKPDSLSICVLRNFIGDKNTLCTSKRRTIWTGVTFGTKQTSGFSECTKFDLDNIERILPERWRFRSFVNSVLNGEFNTDLLQDFHAHVRKAAGSDFQQNIQTMRQEETHKRSRNEQNENEDILILDPPRKRTKRKGTIKLQRGLENELARIVGDERQTVSFLTDLYRCGFFDELPKFTTGILQDFMDKCRNGDISQDTLPYKVFANSQAKQMGSHERSLDLTGEFVRTTQVPATEVLGNHKNEQIEFDQPKENQFDRETPVGEPHISEETEQHNNVAMDTREVDRNSESEEKRTTAESVDQQHPKKKRGRPKKLTPASQEIDDKCGSLEGNENQKLKTSAQNEETMITAVSNRKAGVSTEAESLAASEGRTEVGNDTAGAEKQKTEETANKKSPGKKRVQSQESPITLRLASDAPEGGRCSGGTQLADQNENATPGIISSPSEKHPLQLGRKVFTKKHPQVPVVLTERLHGNMWRAEMLDKTDAGTGVFREFSHYQLLR